MFTNTIWGFLDSMTKYLKSEHEKKKSTGEKRRPVKLKLFIPLISGSTIKILHWSVHDIENAKSRSSYP